MVRIEHRIKFRNKGKRFFQHLKIQAKCKTYKHLSEKIKIPYGRLKLYKYGYRGMPKDLVIELAEKFSINLGKYQHTTIDMRKLMKKYSKKGIRVLERKYGKKWPKITGSKSMKKLQKALKEPNLRNKWRKSVEDSLENRFGKDFYKEMGRLGGKKFAATIDKVELKEHCKKMFRKSFRKRLNFTGINFRSEKEIELAKLLVSKDINFEYEKEIEGFYPDFLINKKIIIEVVGFEWKVHIKRTISKINLLNDLGYKVIIYTYPNMVKYFENLPAKILTEINEVDDALVL